MSRPNDPIPLTKTDLEAIAFQLSTAAKTIEGSVEQMKKLKKDTIEPKRWSSAKAAVDELVKFTAEVCLAVLPSAQPKKPRSHSSKLPGERPDEASK